MNGQKRTLINLKCLPSVADSTVFVGHFMLENSLSYRRATVKDLSSICELGHIVNRLHHAAWPQVFALSPDQNEEKTHWLKSLEGDAAATFLACDGDMSVGFVTVQLTDESHCLLQPLRFARIGTLCVAKQMRGQGIGRVLIGHAERWAAACGASEIQLEVWKFNASAERLYEELGYEVRSLTMSKSIEPSVI